MADLGAISASLHEGEAWDDEVTIRMTRHQAIMTLVTLTSQAKDLRDTVLQCINDSIRGDEAARACLPVMVDSYRATILANRAVLAVVMPEMLAEIALAEKPFLDSIERMQGVWTRQDTDNPA